ncbi:recombinase family protein [Paludicola sp. MB14-C6]|uniref:recombinase family protein n=1 Tax=Paludihabitans sp. MB14-C6 TaxID=3070656 RepID=UPI0027DE935D|nr:recombinase family protein [Paludicola sp. MB14-C6]WMJ23488.1 recombinase family protein [Paludicola sp. MB14-C6]
MNVAIYLRKSRAEELSDTLDDTLKKHKDTLLEFAKKNNLIISDIYEEVVSGENLYARTEMLRLLENVESGKYDAVLCMDIDRLGRGTMAQQGIILETLKNSNTKIITPRKIHDLNNEFDEEYTEFQSFFARKELKTITRRLQQGLQKTIQDGGYIANAPYGYSKAVKDKLPTLEIVEEEAKFIRIMFNMYVHEGYGCETIANTINLMGATPRRGAAFNRSTILRILTNPVYIGKTLWNQHKHIKRNTIDGFEKKVIPLPEDQWKTYDAIHPPIIDEELFNKAQAIKKERYHPSCKTTDLANPLAGLVFCSNCGNKMQYRYVRRMDRSYLMCQAKSCIKSTPFDLVENAVLENLKNEIENLKLKIENNKSVETSHFEANLQSIKKELELCKKQKNNLYDLLEQNVYTIEVFTERSKLLDSKIKSLQSSQENIETHISQINKKNIRNQVKQIQNVLAAYNDSDTNKKNTLLKSIIDSIYYYKEPTWKTNQFILTLKLKDI